MIVKNIVWLDKDDNEAELEVSDGQWSCLVYSMPCSVKLNQEIPESLSCNGDYGITSSDTRDFLLRKMDSPYAYEIVGQVHNKEKSIIRVGNLLFTADSEVPGDLNNGDWVQFVTDRLTY